jgi:aryl-alcohol dehydrogenase-like predicted oxidoreductase
VTVLSLGTAQWGDAYGVTNATGRLTDADIARIMDVAADAGITAVDTAAGYGDAEARLRPWASGLEITTKVAGAGPATIAGQVEAALAALGRLDVEIVLLHDWDALSAPTQRQAAAALRDAKAAGLVTRIGVSVYNEAGLVSAAEAFERLDVVQVPANALDRRLDASGTLAALRAGGTRVQVRSAFLQGLLAAPTDGGLGQHPDVEAFHRAAAAEVGRTSLGMALAHVRALPWADDIVVGVTSAAELAAIVAAWQTVPASLAPMSLASADLSLVDPRTWHKRGSL